MTCIAWNGKSIAADRQRNHHGLRAPVTKLFRVRDSVVGLLGNYARALILKRWFEDGADLSTYPTDGADEDGNLVVATGAKLVVYERWPIAMPVESSFYAFGSGRDYAMGAMHRGATPREAIDAAIAFDDGCGMGVDSFDLFDRSIHKDPVTGEPLRFVDATPEESAKGWLGHFEPIPEAGSAKG